MAPVSVRHHLDILQGDNLIAVERLARTGAVGRPQQIYALTEDANRYFPDNFAALASGLLRQLRCALPPERFESALQSVAREFASELDVQEGEQRLSETKMDSIVSFLNERGYLARWETDYGAQDDQSRGKGTLKHSGERVFLLHKCNCPYAGIAAQHHELCIMDQALVDRLVGQSCERIQSLASDDKCCTYRIVLPSPEASPEQSADGVPVQ